jgi:integrase
MAGKRGNGEGTIRKRPDGYWEARITLPSGKRKSLYGETRTEVAQKLTAAKRDRDQGLPVALDERETVGQYLTSWLETIEPTVKPRTWTRYEGEVRNHLIPVLGAVRLSKLSAQHIQSLYSDMQREGYAPATVAHLQAVIHKALDVALRQGRVPRNVADLVTAPSPRKDRREMHVLKHSQAQALLDAAQGERLEALYVLALSTGMRLGELLALRWVDVNLDAGTLQVNHSLHFEESGVWKLTTPKTAKGQRHIRLIPTTLEALREHRASQLGERLHAGPDWQEHDFVFTRADGQPLRGTHVLVRHFRPLLVRAGLPAIRFHDLRHTAATLLLSQGINALVVSQMLGHSDIAITLGIYGHITSDMQTDAAATMERLLTRVRKG